MNLHGAIAAMATPFTADGSAIDEAALRTLIDRMIDDGVHGIVAGASTGEFATMSGVERRALTALVIEHAAGRVPVIVHTGAMTRLGAVELSRDAQRDGATAVMTVIPYYEPISLDEARDFHVSVAESVDIPMVVYNIPDANGLPFPAEFIVDLAREIPNIEYVKESTGNFAQIVELTAFHSDDIAVLCGMDTFVLPALRSGAVGSIVGATNFLTAPMAQMYEADKARDHETAAALWQSMLPAMFALLNGPNYPAAVKAAIRLSGLDVGVPRKPLRAVTEEQERVLAAALGRVSTTAR